MARTITPTVELGLGGSFLALALATAPAFKFWSMRTIDDDTNVTQTAGTEYPTGWSAGNALAVIGGPMVNRPSALPEGGRAIRLNGTSQYLASVYDESAETTDVGPHSLEAVLEIHALPATSQEPAILGGSTEFAVTLKDDGRVYGYYNGSAVVDLPLPALDVPVHIVLARSDGSPDRISLYVNNVVDTATPSNGAINRGHVHLGKHWTNAHYLNATYSFAGFYAAELTAAQVEAHYKASAWTDVSEDVEVEDPITIDRGIKDDSPTARVAATGIATFTLDNSERNSAGTLGFYTPGHVNCREGFRKGIPCRITMTVQDDAGPAVDYVVFVGRIGPPDPEPGEYGSRRTYITATDWMNEAARFQLGIAPVMEDVRADEVFAAIVESMPNQPHGLTLHPCSETYELALDNSRDESVKALEEFVRLQDSELGRAYVSRDGELVCESRYTRPMEYADVALTVDGTMLDQDAAELTDAAVNRVQVTVHPRRVDDAPSDTILYALDRPIELLPGEPQTINVTYVATGEVGQSAERVGGLDMVHPAPGTGYQAFEFDDGSGTNCTSDVTVGVEFGANSAVVTLTNTRTTPGTTSGEATVYVTVLELRGRGVYDFQPQIMPAQDDVAIRSDGLNLLQFDAVYQESTITGDSLARMLLAAHRSVDVRVRSLTINANDEVFPSTVLGCDVSTRIGVIEYMTAVDSEYHINGVHLEFSEGVKCDVTWWLAPTAEGDVLMAWQDVAYAAGNFTAASGNWTVDSGDQTNCGFRRPSADTMQVAFKVVGSDVSAAASELRIAIPGGFLAARTGLVGQLRYKDAAGTVGVGFMLTTAGVGYISLRKNQDAAWTITSSDNTDVEGTTVPFQIQV